LKNEDLQALIRYRRQRLGLTQEQLAQRAGLADSTVSHWEKCKRVPLLFLVKRLLEMKQELDESERKRPRGKTPR